MFQKWRFKRFYTKLKRTKKNATTGEWEISLGDLNRLYDALPLNLLTTCSIKEIYYLSRFTGDFYFANVMDLLEKGQVILNAMRNLEYVPEETTAVTLHTETTSTWFSPTPVLCNFAVTAGQARQLINDLRLAYGTVPADRVSYYQRKSHQVVMDLFSMGEVLAELVVWDGV